MRSEEHMPAVTLSGFNNIDFNSILDAVMKQERLPFSALSARKTTLQQQNTHLRSLAGKLSSLQSAAEKLASSESVSVMTAASSDSTVLGVSATRGGAPGVYDVVVTSRAKAQVTASRNTSAVADIVATGGALSFRVGTTVTDVAVAAG